LFISQNTNGSSGHELDAARSGSLGLMSTGSCCSDSYEQQCAHDGEWQVGASAERHCGRPSDINEAPLFSVSFSVFFPFLFSPAGKP
jgi:hypothetical protein